MGDIGYHILAVASAVASLTWALRAHRSARDARVSAEVAAAAVDASLRLAAKIGIAAPTARVVTPAEDVRRAMRENRPCV